MKKWLPIIIGWIGIGFIYQEIQKRQAEAEATRLAELSGKPILSIGAKCNPFGDVCCDIEPRCGAIYCDAEDLSQFGDKEFSVALLSHVLEHLDNPDRAQAEAERVADTVIVVTPSPMFPQTWLHPDHKWVYFDDRKIRIRGADMSYCFRQVKPASEMDANEVAKTICLQNGQISWGSQGHSGTPTDVWINPGCPARGKAIGTYHTHPQGTSEPSPQDVEEMVRAGLLFLCVHGDDALSCYRMR